MTTLEVCVDSATGLRIAGAAALARIELCGPLAVGGTTPSLGLMRAAAHLALPVYAMIRPRDGDFVFDRDDEAVMLADIHAVQAAGLAGVVLGANRADGTLDAALLSRLADACAGLGRTLHRAFDLVPDPLEALEIAIDLGFERVLTSGQARSAIDGMPVLAALERHAAGRISIMAGAGVTPANVGALVAATGVREVHASCRAPAAIDDTRHPDVQRFGFETSRLRTDRTVIDAMLETLGRASS